MIGLIRFPEISGLIINISEGRIMSCSKLKEASSRATQSIIIANNFPRDLNIGV